MRLLPSITLSLALLTTTAMAAPVATQVTAPVQAPHAPGLSYNFPLAKFFPLKGPMRIKDADGIVDMYFPMSGRFQPREAIMSLEFTNSIALLHDRSVLSVRINGTTVGQIHLDPQKPRGSAQIAIPVDVLKPGYNQITFAAAQHYTLECEDPESPELWTEIDTNKSTLYVQGDLRADTPMLSRLSEIFSPGLGGLRDLTIVTGQGEMDNATFQAGAMVAEGVALRSQYEDVSFHRLQDLTPTSLPSDYAVVGTTAQLGGVLSKETLASIAGPTVAIDAAPGDPTHLRLMIVGRTSEETLMAGRAFSLMDFPFSDASHMTVSDIHPADVKLPAMASNYLMPEQNYSLRNLGKKTVTIRTSGTHTTPLDINMPPDLYGADNAMVGLHLDFAYGAGMGPGSVVNVMLNGEFVRAIHLNHADGEVFHDYLISIPLRSFKAGANQLGFEVVMAPETSGHCMERSSRHLIFALMDTSYLSMPKVGHYASQPDLGLFGHTGFPYVAPDELKNSALAVSDPALAAAGWTLAGKLAQVAKAPLDGMDFVIGATKNYRHTILLSPVKNLTQDMFSAVDYSIGDMHKVPYPSLQYLKSEKDGSWLSEFNAVGGKAEAHPQSDGTIIQASDLGRNIVMLGMASSGNPQGSTTLITARDGETLSKGVTALVRSDMWPQLDGTLDVWQDTPDSFASVDLGGKFSLGEKDPLLGLRYNVSHWPALWIAGALAGMLALTMMTRILLRGRSKRKGQ